MGHGLLSTFATSSGTDFATANGLLCHRVIVHSFNSGLVLFTSNAANTPLVQVIEAQLTLLLRLFSPAQTSGQSSDSFQAISKLIHCKVCFLCTAH